MSDNPERFSFPFRLGGPGTMTADKQFSNYVSRTLDCLGKNQNMIKFRVKIWKKVQEFTNIINRRLHFTEIIAGSKAEGLTSMFKSDFDRMFVVHGVICADNFRHFMHTKTIVFQTDRHDSPAGYTKLKLVKGSSTLSGSVLDYSLFDNENEDKYLSSDFFVTTLAHDIIKGNNNYVNLYERSGPSLPMSDPEGISHEDKVLAMRCVCPTLLQSFLTRPRPYNRPSLNKLHDISLMDAHVVPVGHKGSNESHYEWRICFTEAEIYLVQKFNETETKLYIILKMVSKLLKFISNDITSYVMKNIVLWLVELYPVDIFTEDLLTYQLIQALRFLQKCVELNFLPNYMIPERNLLSNRLNRIERLKLNTFLSTLIPEGGCLLLRCEKLRYGMIILYREPDMAEKFRNRRDMGEKLLLIMGNILNAKIATTGLSQEEMMRLIDTDVINDTIFKALPDIIYPEFTLHLQQEYSAEALTDLYTKRLRQLL